MSGFKQHAIAGVATGAAAGIGVVFLSKNIPVSLGFFLAVVAGSLAPDIDTGSIPSKWFARLGILASSVFMYKGADINAAIVGLLYMAFSSDKHRGFTHGYLLILSCMVLGVIAVFLKIPQYFVFLAPFSVGLCIHKMLDE